MHICIFKVLHAEKLYKCFSFSLQKLLQHSLRMYGHTNKDSCCSVLVPRNFPYSMLSSNVRTLQVDQVLGGLDSDMSS